MQSSPQDPVLPLQRSEEDCARSSIRILLKNWQELATKYFQAYVGLSQDPVKILSQDRAASYRILKAFYRRKIL
jgi:hypothetical protein